MYYRRTGAGERVRELLAEPRRVSDLHATLLDEYDVAPDVLLHDLRALLGELAEVGLVVVAPAEPHGG
jgi:hypothetical protein